MGGMMIKMTQAFSLLSSVVPTAATTADAATAFVGQRRGILVERNNGLRAMPTTGRRRNRSYIISKSRLYGMTRRNTAGDNNDEDGGEGGEGEKSSSFFDAEAARRQLQLLFPEATSNSSSRSMTVKELVNEAEKNDDEKKLVLSLSIPPPPLTVADRDRRIAEIKLLRELESNDDPIITRSLWELWFSERGVGARKLLQQADTLMSNPDQWNDCENLLSDMIVEYGPYFAEPVNRLATLYYLQGRVKESYGLCRVVLTVKPWHIGALSGIVQVLMAQNDREGARYWVERCLPTLRANQSAAPYAGGSKNPQRREWVQRAVQDAETALEEAEARTKESLGKPEDYYDQTTTGGGGVIRGDDGDIDDSAWQ